MIWTDISSTPGEYGGISPEASGACMASAWTRKETSMWPKWTADASRSSVHARASIRLSWWASRSILRGNREIEWVVAADFTDDADGAQLMPLTRAIRVIREIRGYDPFYLPISTRNRPACPPGKP